jgi:hypothetical protein
MTKLPALIKPLGLFVLIIIVVFGFKPFTSTIDPEKALINETGVYPNEIKRLSDATYLVSVRTPMPGVTAKMVQWWFSDFLQTTEHYNWWHPKDHVWMDWENKQPGKIVGASHLVHEYIGQELSKLRIQFINASELFGYDPNNENTFIICARVGLLDEKINIAKMCHIVRNTLNGAEMRSRFWLGHVAKRKENKTISSLEGLVGNTFLARLLVLKQKDAIDLKRHAEEEMKYLAELLPPLYRSSSIS